MIRVSDHALLRFLDRAAGFDVEGLRSALEMSLDRAHAAAAELGVLNYAIRVEGNTYIVRGTTVTTVIADAKLSSRARFQAHAPRSPAD